MYQDIPPEKLFNLKRVEKDECQARKGYKLTPILRLQIFTR